MSTFSNWLDINEQIGLLYESLILEELILESVDDETWGLIQAAQQAFAMGNEAEGNRLANDVARSLYPLVKRIASRGMMEPSQVDDAVAIVMGGEMQKSGAMKHGLVDMLKNGNLHDREKVVAFLSQALRDLGLSRALRFKNKEKADQMSRVADTGNRKVDDFVSGGGMSREKNPFDAAAEKETSPLEEIIPQALSKAGISDTLAQAFILTKLKNATSQEAADQLGTTATALRRALSDNKERIMYALRKELEGTAYDPT